MTKPVGRLKNRFRERFKSRLHTSCPPDMTEAMRQSFLQEIADFNSDPKTMAEIKKDIEESAKAKPATDAYSTWLDNNEGHELPEANPDILADNEGIQYIVSHKNAETAHILREFRLALTSRELQVWNLIMQQQYSFRKAAQVLKINQSTLRTYLTRAKSKFMKYMEAIKRVEKD